MEITNKNKNILTWLLLVPVFLSFFLQGGYFQWEKYLIFLMLIPFMFFYSFKFSDYFFSLKEKGFLLFSFYWLTSFLTVIISVNKGATIEKSIEIFFYLILFYFLANAVYNGFIKKKSVENFIILLGILGSIISILSVVLIKNKENTYISEAILHYITNRIITSNTNSASAFFGYRNTFGAFMCIPFFVLLGTDIWGKNKFKIIFKYLLLILFAFTIFLSQSRFAIVIFIFLLLLFPLLRVKGRRRESFVYVLSMISTFSAFSIFGNAIFYKYLIETLNRFSLGINYLVDVTGKIFDVSIYQRIEMLKYSFEIFKQNPLLGTGRGTYPYIYNVFKTNSLYAEDPHSFIFLLLAEAGFIGLFSASILFVFFLIKRNKQETGMFVGVMAVLFHLALDFDTKFMSINLLILLLVTFLLYENTKIKLTKNNCKLIGIKMLTLLLVVTSIPMAGNFYYNKFICAYNGNIILAYSNIQKAVFKFGQSSEYNYQAGKYLLTKIIMEKEDYDLFLSEEGEAYYLKAISLAPTFWKYYDALGNYYLSIDELNKALPMLKKNVELNKYNPGGYFKLSECYLRMDNEEMNEYYKNLGLYYLNLNKY